MIAASMSHHSWQYRASIGVQTDEMTTPLDEYVAPAAAPYAATASPIPVIEYATPALVDTFTAPSPVTQDVAPASAVTNAAPAPMIEYVAPVTPETVNDYVAPAPVIEYIAPPPAVFYPSFYASFSQPNEAVTSLVNPQISITAVEASQVIDFFPLSEDFAAVMYNQVIRNRSLQQYSRKLLFRKFLSFRLWSGFRNKLW